MLEDEIKTMLNSLIENKKNFRKFYKTRYFQYSKDNTFEGAVAIADNDTIISFLKYINDDSKVIATANFQYNGKTVIFKLFDDNFLIHDFGAKTFTNSCSSCVRLSNRDDIVKKISSIIKYCKEAQKVPNSSKTQVTFQGRNIFDIEKSKLLYKKEIFSRLEDTLNKLNKTKILSEKGDGDIVPKISVPPISNESISISNPDVDKTR